MGLSGRNYGTIARPFTGLLKKNAWKWTDTTTTAFEQLKMSLSTTPVLALPDFELDFYVDADASRTSVGVVLQQQEQHVAFFSKGLRVRHQALSIYEKEMLAVKKWHSYLVVRHFKIRTDH